jgi:hypothetical protein
VGKLKISGLILLLMLVSCRILLSQQTKIKGFVSDSTGKPLESVSISLLNSSHGTYSDKAGSFTLNVPTDGNDYFIMFSHLGFKSDRIAIKCDRPEIIVNVILSGEVIGLGEITVSSGRAGISNSLMLIPLRDIHLFPSPSGSFESILKTMPGVSSNNELSSQYSVRGGNYDENLVYVNDVEIFRPFLIRSGQQEGLSFINPDLVSSVKFSSGGFSAVFGDKMSSVLDITYRSPVSSKGSVSLSLLTSSVHYEGISKNKKISFLLGIRYKSSRLMLKTLDSKGDYQPVFADIQSLINFKTGQRSNLSLLSAFSSNTYNFFPQSRESSFGNDAAAYRLYVLFAGGEKDIYSTWNNNLTWMISERNNFSHKIILSAFKTTEKESYDIRGWYSLNSLDKDYGTNNLSDSVMNIGVGEWLSHARNYLTANIFSFAYKGEKKWGSNSVYWGLKLRHNIFDDKIKEWTKSDSAGYSLPVNTEYLLVTSLIRSQNSINFRTYDTYLQVAKNFTIGYHKLSFDAGVRAIYNSYTSEFLISPRATSAIEAGKNLSFHLSGGIYYQSPFYKEMRFPDGSLNEGIKSQKSIHSIFGMNYYFKAWGRPFSLTTEIYNKTLSNIIPYRLDNVRVIYTGENSAVGYSRGIDFRVNGEFVPDAESWISLSIMDSKLKIPLKEYGRFPSPSDQTVNLNIFFQDYLPGNPTWRAHINIAFVTGIPTISSFNDRYDQYHRLPAYRRVDMGITKLIKGPDSNVPGVKLLKYFNEVYTGVEIFNLMDINNTISYLWIKTVNNLSGDMRTFAVPNYLTGRSLNLILSATF